MIGEVPPQVRLAVGPFSGAVAPEHHFVFISLVYGMHDWNRYTKLLEESLY